MLHLSLIRPESIAVIGASENLSSPGGKVLFNLLRHGYSGKIYPVNPKSDTIQGIKCYRDIGEIPQTDLAIIAVAARYCKDIVRELALRKNTRGFIIFSAGFSELNEEGAVWEREIADIVESVGGSLLGPNNIGMMNRHYTGVFTTPVPALHKGGVDFISGSGATAVFIMETALKSGLRFHSVFSVGNSVQTGVEEVLQHLDETYKEGESARVVMMYLESIRNPAKLLKHAVSLHKKGVRMLAVKAGSSEAGSRAASSHTGALANPDEMVNALFRKAGIIRCYGRNELVYTAAVLSYKPLKGGNMAVITHAGGPAVMLTDALSEAGLQVPYIKNSRKNELLDKLHPGSSVSNPIDFLATGTAEQLDTIIEYCERYFDEIDAMAVIFGSPGLFPVNAAYEVLEHRINTCTKPIFPILPSVINAEREIESFTSAYPAFFDETAFGQALGKVYGHSYFPLTHVKADREKRQSVLSLIPNGFHGYLPQETVYKILEISGIPVVKQWFVNTKEDLSNIMAEIPFPAVMKVTGPVHKTEVNGVRLNVPEERAGEVFEVLMQIPQAGGVLIQPFIRGMELYAGVAAAPGFGHGILFGAGGTDLEIDKDYQMCLAPLSREEIRHYIRKLRIYPLLEGYRGKPGIDLNQWMDLILKLSSLTVFLPEIKELDLNPVIATKDAIAVVDARIRI